MTRPRIDTDELRKLLGDVTPGKWEATMTHPTNACANVDQADGYVSIATCYGGDEDSEQDEHGMWSSQPIRDANATLIALSPELADELIRLRAHAEAMAEALGPFSKSGEIFPGEAGSLEFDQCIYNPAAGSEYSLCGDDLRRARAALAAYRAATRENEDGK